MTVILTKEEVLKAFSDYIERHHRYSYSNPLTSLSVVDWHYYENEVSVKLEEPQPEEPVEAVPALEEPDTMLRKARELREKMEDAFKKPKQEKL